MGGKFLRKELKYGKREARRSVVVLDEFKAPKPKFSVIYIYIHRNAEVNGCACVLSSMSLDKWLGSSETGSNKHS